MLVRDRDEGAGNREQGTGRDTWDAECVVIGIRTSLMKKATRFMRPLFKQLKNDTTRSPGTADARNETFFFASPPREAESRVAHTRALPSRREDGRRCRAHGQFGGVSRGGPSGTSVTRVPEHLELLEHSASRILGDRTRVQRKKRSSFTSTPRSAGRASSSRRRYSHMERVRCPRVLLQRWIHPPGTARFLRTGRRS